MVDTERRAMNLQACLELVLVDFILVLCKQGLLCCNKNFHMLVITITRTVRAYRSYSYHFR